jgi:hypothetical protein
MKRSTLVAICAVAFAVPLSTLAQEKASVVAVDEVEAVVTVVDVDREAREVTVRGPRGRVVTIAVPPEAQNLDQVHPGSRFKVRYAQSAVLALSKGSGQAAATSATQAELAAKGDIPGGMIVSVNRIDAIVEGIDAATRTIAVRGPEGNVREFTVSDEVKSFDQVKVGDTITLEVTEALAMRMIPQ